MAHPYHHAVSSAKKWGGTADQYQPLHDWFDATKRDVPDFRHRALRHHSEGIFLCEQIFGPTITIELSNGRTKEVPTRWVGEQHVKEDLGFIPNAADWLRQLRPTPWMTRSQKLSEELERETDVAATVTE